VILLLEPGEFNLHFFISHRRDQRTLRFREFLDIVEWTVGLILEDELLILVNTIGDKADAPADEIGSMECFRHTALIQGGIAHGVRAILMSRDRDLESTASLQNFKLDLVQYRVFPSDTDTSKTHEHLLFILYRIIYVLSILKQG
jgi:hypothetical protein